MKAINTANITHDQQPESSWQHLLSHCFSDPVSLAKFLQLEADQLNFSAAASSQFSLKVPLPYAMRMQKGDSRDPLLLQVLPDPRELEYFPGFVTDPLQEADANHLTGLIHKYQNRVLLMLSGACAINCRYCFRRHFPYDDNKIGSQQWQNILQYIENDNSIEEVIFSGGDPLATSDQRLDKFITQLGKIKHLQRLRIHSRLPVVIPQRITDHLCQILQTTRLQTVLVIHANHANEFDHQVSAALAKLQAAKVTVLNQAVLLKGINDSVESQKRLHTASFAAGALPYYLFVLDPVQGAAHFDISDSQAQQLIRELQRQLPGYLLPRLAREIPGMPHKTLLAI
ncbi:MAG: EF-P beta-lysylation protein EpmB [Pseudomonadales bacterium]|nr:EF-P beta-lysylation protein EpmB [Pseudomonadales bacterium]NRA14996.1 EF-P beta-lysylation protein EpmB [Oceanospirillaceae bacterium]